jgi:hypothetical protein
MKSMRWQNLNPLVREVLDAHSENKWSARAIARLILFVVVLPLWLIGTGWAIVADTNWGRLGANIQKVAGASLFLIASIFSALRSVSFTNWLLICILLVLVNVRRAIDDIYELICKGRPEPDERTDES